MFNKINFRIGKRGVLFTLISILFAVLFVTIFSYGFKEAKLQSNNPERLRVKVLDSYMRNFEQYSSDNLRVGTYETFDVMTNNVKGSGFYANKAAFNLAFETTLTNSLNTKLDVIKSKADTELNIQSKYTINKITLSQKYAYEVDVSLDITYYAADKANPSVYSNWSKTKIINGTVSILGLKDPYILRKDNAYTRTIKRYNGDCEFSDTCWNLAEVKSFYDNEQYRYSPSAPSFLQRFYDDQTGSNCCGIETFINPTKTAATTNIMIDRLYWSTTQTCVTDKNILKYPTMNNLILNVSNAGRYNITNDGTPYCPP